MRRLLKFATLAALATLPPLACDGRASRLADHLGARPAAAATAAPAAASSGDAGVPPDTIVPTEAKHFYALVINGGGAPAQNYQSHHLHVLELLDLLRSSGLPADHISVLESDGTNPVPDMAARGVQPEANFWMLHGTPLEDPLRMPIVFENSKLPALTATPATPASLRAWFAAARTRLHAGDTLLLYVTDHGTRGKTPRENAITLWGQSITVADLDGLLATLAPGVRVVSLMSQCFSGGFAELAQSHPPGGPRGGFCGYFSSTADRPAYGCYPENKNKSNVGHSFHFLAALAAGRSFPRAQLEVLTSDQTPDVPLATSDLFLRDRLTRAAAARKRPLNDFADELLKEAWRDGKRWEPEIRLLDRLGQAFGMWSARSLAELDAQAGTLPEFNEKVESHKRAWDSAEEDLNYGRLQHLGERPEWKGKLDPSAIAALGETQRRATAARVLAALEALPSDKQRLISVHERSDLTAALAYRIEVRLAVVLRMRARLLDLAARVYLDKYGRAEDKHQFAGLTACEALRLPPRAKDAPPPPAPEQPTPFPPFKDDVDLAGRVLPAWMGIGFAGVSPELQRKYRLPSGVAFVNTVYPGSPAEAAGLHPGDIVLGPEGHPFTEHNEVRVWTFTQTPGKAQRLQILRNGAHVTVTLTPRPFPGALPALPGPPKPGTPAPALSIAPYRGKLPELAHAPHLLFFWATYCGPCKASLPEVLAFGKQSKIPVIAISDEPRETLDEFFVHWKQPFPDIVAEDEMRSAHIAYGTSGVPTFVYVDAAGVIRSHVTGYLPSAGIGVPGWHYQANAAGK